MTTTTTTTRPMFVYYRVFGDGMEAHELWASYSAESEMLENCSAALHREGDEVEEYELYTIVYHDYFESC